MWRRCGRRRVDNGCPTLAPSRSFSIRLTAAGHLHEAVLFPNLRIVPASSLARIGSCTPLHLCTTALAHHCTTAPLHHCTSAPLHHCSTAPLHHCTSAPLHHCSTAPLHHCTTAPLHHCTTAPLQDATPYLESVVDYERTLLRNITEREANRSIHPPLHRYHMYLIAE